MQFSCESCKTQLQIADEKVRGKRLIVRCKRCGAKIGISDPALGPPKSAQRPASAPAPAPAPAQAAAPAAHPRPAPAPHPAPSRAPAPARAADARSRNRDSDTDSTVAMDSNLLEKALQASKADDPSIAPRADAEPAPRASEPPPAASGDEPTWFAMLHGKQEGPMTRAELTAKTDQGAVGPRTYLWKDGMEAWQRAKDLPELQPLFPPLPQAPPRAPPPPAAPPVGQGLREFSTPDFVAPVAASKPPAEVKEQPKAPAAERAAPQKPAATPAAKEAEERTSVELLPLGERVHQEGVAKELFSTGETESVKSAKDLAGWATAELEKKKPAQASPAAPRAVAPHTVMFASAAPAESRLPLVMIAVVAVLAAVAVAFWFAFGSVSTPPPSEKKEEAAGAPHPPVSATPAKPDATPEAKTPPKPEAAQTGLTADQVRKKLDENKSALQGCIDEALRRDPNLRVGKIHIATTIAPSGQVTTAKIDKNTVDQSPLGACLRRATKRIAFPSFAGDAFDVDIPIVVTAGE